MKPFAYERAATEAGAVAALAGDPNASSIAGGTALLDLMKTRVEAPGRLVDIGGLSGPASEVREGEDGLRIGGLAKMGDVGGHPAVRAGYPVLSEAILAASPQIRNVATIGGNLLQRARCGYFRDRDVASCNKRDPGSGCAAMAGEHRNHAILGTNERCIATHPSDASVALVALDALVETARPGGATRRVPVADLHLLPGETPHKETVLEHGELIVAVEVPASPLASRSRYVKVSDRASFAYALVSAAVALDVCGDGAISEARVVLGGVAHKPWRSLPAEEALVGRQAAREAFEAAASASVLDARPLRDNAFKVELAKRVVTRALAEAVVAAGAAR